jgi:hypothetical protein
MTDTQPTQPEPLQGVNTTQINSADQPKKSWFDKIWSNAFIIIAVLAVVGFIAVVVLKLATGASLKAVTKTLFVPVLAGLGGLIQWLFKKQKEHEQKLDQAQHTQKLELEKIQKDHESKLLQTQHDHQLALERSQEKQRQEVVQQQQRFNDALKLQQREFSSALTIQKKTEVVEQVIAKLEDHSFVTPQSGRKRRMMAEIRQLRELFYKVLIYFQDPCLLDNFKKSFVACFQGRPDQIMVYKHEIINRFRAKLHPLELEQRASSQASDFNMEDHLRDLVRSYLQVENGIVPIQVVQHRKGNYNKQYWIWLNLRFSSECTKEDLQSLSNNIIPAKEIDKIEKGDALVFWEDKYGDALDGILGIAWIKKVEKKDKNTTFQIGYRETVAPGSTIPFDKIQKIGPHKEEESLLSPEVAQQLQTNQSNLDFESVIRGNLRVSKYDINYMVLDGFGRSLDELKRHHSTVRLADFTMNGRILIAFQSKIPPLALCIDVDRYMDNEKMMDWLYNFANWVALEEIVFNFRGAEHKISQFIPIATKSEARGTSVDPFQGEKHFEKNNVNLLLDLSLFKPEDRKIYKNLIHESFSWIKLQLQIERKGRISEEDEAEAKELYVGLGKTPQDVEIKFLSSESPYTMMITEVNGEDSKPKDLTIQSPV